MGWRLNATRGIAAPKTRDTQFVEVVGTTSRELRVARRPGQLTTAGSGFFPAPAPAPAPASGFGFGTG